MHKLLRRNRRCSSGGKLRLQKDCQADVGNGRVISRVRCRSKRCRTCGPVWAGDFRQRMLLASVAYGGDVGLLTITAPGQHGPHRLPFVPGTRKVRADYAAKWNRSAPRRWSEMHRVAATRARRKFGNFKLVAYVWAYQERGAQHLHVLLPGATPRERAASLYYVKQLAESGGELKLTEQFAFGNVKLGCEMGGSWYEFVSVLRMQAYLVKYLTKDGAGGRPEMLETVLHEDAPARPFYVRQGLTPMTMQVLRWRRRAWMLVKLHGCEPLKRCYVDTPEKIVAVIARLSDLPPPLTPHPV